MLKRLQIKWVVEHEILEASPINSEENRNL